MHPTHLPAGLLEFLQITKALCTQPLLAFPLVRSVEAERSCPSERPLRGCIIIGSGFELNV
jgi:hypothetical protein